MKIAFIGLGNMGAPMARNLIKAGHSLNLFDLNKDILAELAALGGQISTSPREAAKGTEPAPEPVVMQQTLADDMVNDLDLGDLDQDE